MAHRNNVRLTLVMPCLDDNAVVQLLSGDLSERERASFDTHIDSCLVCRELVTNAGRALTDEPDEPDGQDGQRGQDDGSTVRPVGHADVTLAAGKGAAQRFSQLDVQDVETIAERLAQVLEAGLLVDHFEIMRLLGRGGMGEVYLARDTKLGRKVALKVIRPALLDSAEALARFQREAQAMARFQHPHILTIYAVGEHEQLPYVALEYIEGSNLRERLERRPMALAEALRICIAVAEALVEAHGAGVLHRDLKPHNVLMSGDGRILVADFGLAKLIQTEAVSLRQPQLVAASDVADSSVFGSPRYMAPEQWHQAALSPETDVWALGNVLFELISGRPPFDQPTWALQWKEVCSSRSAPRLDECCEVPGAVADLVATCLEKDSSKRPSAQQLAASLRELAQPGLRSMGATESPFRGLLPFRERHAAWFFGRDREIAAFVERMRGQPVMPVVGSSGAGKSSFVGAGVVPRLREQERWQVVKLRPGARPLHALAFSLQRQQSEIATEQLADRADDAGDDTDASGEAEPSDGSDDGDRISELPRSPLELETNTERLVKQLAESPLRLAMELRALAAARSAKVLLFVDQFEELFTLCDDEAAQAAFIEAVCCAADDAQDPVRVVFTIRDDFLGRMAAVGASRAALSQVTVLHAPDARALASIIERPLMMMGYSCDDEQLASDMVQAVRGEPACLPLLEFVASELWSGRDQEAKLLLRSVYDELGGVEGALSSHADGVLAGLGSEQLAAARSLLLRLVTVERTRKVVSKEDALEGLSVKAEAVLERLTEARLISVSRVGSARGKSGPSDSMLELAHESLVTTWGTLAKWIDESREDLAFIAEAQQAAELWHRRGRLSEELWQGAALQDALRSRARCDEVPELVSAFLAASEEREDKTRRRRRWFKLVAATVLVGLTAVAVAVSLVIAKKERTVRTERDRAEHQRHEAVRGRAEATLRRAEALSEGALAAWQQRSLIESRTKLRLSLELADSSMARALWWQLSGVELQWQMRLDTGLYGLTMSPNGSWLATGGGNKVIHVLDTRTAKRRVLRGHRTTIKSLATSPDGRVLVSSSFSGSLRFWNVRTGEHLRKITAHKGNVHTVAFSPDGKLLATAGSDRIVRVWHVATMQQHRVLEGHGGSIYDLSFSADGSILASASYDKTVRVWRLQDVKAPGRVLARLSAGANTVQFDVTGRMLAVGGHDRTVRLLDATNGKQLRQFDGHRASVWRVRFDPTGRWLASCDLEGAIRIWSLAGDAPVRVLTDNSAGIGGVAFGPEGRLVASVDVSGQLRMLRLSVREPRANRAGHRRAVYAVAFGPEGRQLVSAGHEGALMFWDMNTAEPVRTAHVGKPLASLIMIKDGRVIAGDEDETLWVWNPTSAHAPRPVTGHTSGIWGLSMRPDGGLLASASSDRTVRLWRLPSMQSGPTTKGHQAGAFWVDFRADGQQLASAGYDRAVRIWDGSNGKLLRTLRLTSNPWRVFFVPGKDELVVLDADNQIHLWDLPSSERTHIGSSSENVVALAITPSGNHLIGGLGDGTLKQWDLRGKRSSTMTQVAHAILSIAIAPAGDRLAFSDIDGTLRLWDMHAARPVWRAPLLLAAPARLYSHRGWTRLRDVASVKPVLASWRSAVEQRGLRGELSPGGATLCLHTFDRQLEVWDMRADVLKRRLKAEGLRALRALPGGCLLATATSARIVTSASHIELVAKTKVGAVARAGRNKVLVHSDAHVRVFDMAGNSLADYPTGVGVSAVALLGDHLIVGYADGGLDLYPKASVTREQVTSFQHAPDSAPTRIIAGPPGIVAVGFTNGTIGMWSISDGERLAEEKLHGSVQHLLLEDKWLYAATDLGQHLSWDFSAFYEDYCVLMRQIWKRVPTVWQAGRAVMGAPPADHRCAPVD